MYLLQSDGITIHRPVDTVSVTKKIVSGTLTQELNCSDKLEFAIPPTNQMCDGINNLTSQIVLTDSSAELFRGRPIDQNSDFYRNNKIKCNGFLDYLNDAVARPATVSGMTAKEFISYVIAEYNSQVEDYKQFKVGEVTDGLTIELEYDYSSTHDVLFSKLIGAYGGYIKHRRVGNTNYIDYTLNSGVEVPGTAVKFGQNLLDLQKFLNAANVYTVLVPYGEDGITISGVNNGNDYIESSQGINVFGRVCKAKKFDGITTPAELLTVATADLNSGIAQALTLELTAVEMHLLNIDISSLFVGNYYKVVSPPHGIDDYFLCSKKSIDLLNAQNSKVIFGYTRNTLTDLIKRKVI